MTSVSQKHATGLIVGTTTGLVFTTACLTAPYTLPVLAGYGVITLESAVILSEVSALLTFGQSALAIAETAALWSSIMAFIGLITDVMTQLAIETLEFTFRLFIPNNHTLEYDFDEEPALEMEVSIEDEELRNEFVTRLKDEGYQVRTTPIAETPHQLNDFMLSHKPPAEDTPEYESLVRTLREAMEQSRQESTMTHGM